MGSDGALLAECAAAFAGDAGGRADAGAQSAAPARGPAAELPERQEQLAARAAELALGAGQPLARRGNRATHGRPRIHQRAARQGRPEVCARRSSRWRREALNNNRGAFLDLARASFEGYQKEAALQIESRHKALDTLVQPITDTLSKVDARLRSRSASGSQASRG